MGSSKINKLTQEINSYPTFNNVALDQYKKVGSVDDIDLFENKTTFPFIFNTKLAKINAKYAPEKNPFTAYNDLFKELGVNKLYKPVTSVNGKELSLAKIVLLA